VFFANDIPKLKKNLSLNCKLLDNNFDLETRWGVFSPKKIDDGTLMLLEYLDIKKNDICFDLGCGYGPIGLSMAKKASNGKSYLVDKDFIAIELSIKNAELNKINNAYPLLSDGFSHIDKNIKFTQVVSNLPAKVGREQLSIFLYDALDYMEIGGKITVVTINGLRQFIKTNFKSVFGNYKKLKQGAQYTVSQAVKER